MAEMRTYPRSLRVRPRNENLIDRKLSFVVDGREVHGRFAVDVGTVDSERGNAVSNPVVDLLGRGERPPVGLAGSAEVVNDRVCMAVLVDGVEHQRARRLFPPLELGRIV